MYVLNKTKLYSIISGVCFLLAGVNSTKFMISMMSGWNGDLTLNIVLLPTLVHTTGIIFAIILFVGKKNIVLPIASSFYALFYFYLLTDYFTLDRLFLSIAFVGLFIVSMFERKNLKGLKMIWFLPAVVLLLGSLISWMTSQFYTSFYILLDLIEVAGFFFTGLWLKEGKSKNEVNDFDTKKSLINSADEIKTFKELLDDGAITQEEFDKIKKQILS
ncbi:MAG TPA: SHOCT domain-containing protein [Clostridia bacterium]|nr:SHOCT domain-containing protein [Clostridia bacterium]